MDIKSVSTEKKSKEGIPTLPGGFFKRKPIIADPKVGRNQLCPCGSKKKYKKCCLKKMQQNTRTVIKQREEMEEFFDGFDKEKLDKKEEGKTQVVHKNEGHHSCSNG